MKIRSGFVSNSSTSSFVIIGFDATSLFSDSEDVWEDAENLLDEKEINADIQMVVIADSSNDEEEHTIIGKLLFDWDSYESVESEGFDFSVVAKEVEAIREKLGVDAPVKLYAGTVQS